MDRTHLEPTTDNISVGPGKVGPVPSDLATTTAGLLAGTLTPEGQGLYITQLPMVVEGPALQEISCGSSYLLQAGCTVLAPSAPAPEG